MKMASIKHLLIFSMLFVSLNLLAKVANETAKTLINIINEIERGVDETRYNELALDATVIINANSSIEKTVEELFKIHPNLLTKTIGPLLETDISKYRTNVRSRGDFNSYLSLAMLQDTASLGLILEKIFDERRYQQFEYIKLLALYGEKAKAYIPLLQWIKENHWYKPVIDISDFVIKIISSQENKLTNWSRIELWKDLKKISKDACNLGSNPVESHQYENSKNSINHEDLKYLESLGLPTSEIIFTWKGKATFNYLIKNKNSLVGITYNDEVVKLKNLPAYMHLKDVFNIGRRLFFVVEQSHSIDKEAFIFELFESNNQFEYLQVFSLGVNYKGVRKTSKKVTIVGINWLFNIDLNAVLYSGLICGQEVLINKSL